MKKNSFALFIFSGFLVLTMLAGIISPASALPLFASNPTGQNAKGKHPPTNPTHYHLHLLPPRLSVTITPTTFTTIVGLSQPFTLEGFLKDQNGKPVTNKPITFRINGVYLGSERTNTVGGFKHKFNNLFSAGTYLISASSTESHLLEATSTTTTLKILPTVVSVQTIPAMAGIPFTLGGVRFVSGSNGIATTNVKTPGVYRLNVLTEGYHNPSNHIEFARWVDDTYQTYKFVQVPTNQVIQVGFNIYHKVGQSFVDLGGQNIDPTRVTEFTIRSAQGDMFVLHDGQPRWIPASRIARRADGLEETKLLYSVLSVSINGSNVVNSAQQRFYTYPIENWPISLLLYSMHISAKDGLLGTPVGKSVNIEFPDGHVENYPLNAAGVAEIPSLARGNYTAELVGINGLSSRTPVALSRNQDLSAKVITYTDLELVGFLGAFVALALLLFGRPKLIFFWKKNDQLILAHEEVLDEVPVSVPEQVFDYRHMRYETVKLLGDKEFKVSTGIDRESFERMHAFFMNDTHPGSGKAKLSEADQILLTILFLQGLRSQFDLSQIYLVSETTVRRTVKKVKKIMREYIQSRQVEENESQPDENLMLTDMFQDPKPIDKGIE